MRIYVYIYTYTYKHIYPDLHLFIYIHICVWIHVFSVTTFFYLKKMDTGTTLNLSILCFTLSLPLVRVVSNMQCNTQQNSKSLNIFSSDNIV